MQDEEQIRLRAYELWELEGRPEGRHVDHWEQACRDYAEEDARVTDIAADIAIEPDTGAGVGNLGDAAAALREENQGSAGGEKAAARDRNMRAMESPAVSTPT